MRDKDFHEIVELSYFEDPCEEIAVVRVDGNTQRHFVLAIGDAVFDHVVDHFFVLVVGFVLFFSSAAFDVSLDALVHQNLCELVFGRFDIELSCSFEGVVQSLVVVVEVEVEFGQQEGDEGFVGEGGVLVEFLAGWGDGYMRLMSLAMSIQCRVMWESSFLTPISLRSASSSVRRLLYAATVLITLAIQIFFK